MNNEIPVFCNDFVKTHNQTICALSNVNAVCNIENGNVDYLYSIKGDTDICHAFSKAFQYMDKIVFVPFYANVILVMDVKAGKMREIKLPFDGGTEKQKFYTAFQNGRVIYMLSVLTPNILEFDIKSEKYINICVDNTDYKYDGSFFFSIGAEIIEDYVYMPLGYKGALLKMSLKTKAIETITIPNLLAGINAISKANDELLILGNDGNICKLVRWNLKSEEYRVISLFKAPKNKKIFFHPPIKYKGKIYLFPFSLWKSYVIDIKSNVAEENIVFEQCFWSAAQDGMSFLKFDNNAVYFQMINSGEWARFNFETESAERYGKYMLSSDEFMAKRSYCSMVKMIRNNEVIKEENANLKIFLKYLGV